MPIQRKTLSLIIFNIVRVEVNVNVGQLTTVKLTIASDSNRTVRCYTSHPSLSYFPSGFDKPFAISSGPASTIPINVRSLSVKNQNIIVNCVDVATKELIRAWIVKLIGSDPKITKTIDLVVKCGAEVTHKFVYENRLPSFGSFEFVSSNPDLLQVKFYIILLIKTSLLKRLLQSKEERKKTLESKLLEGMSLHWPKSACLLVMRIQRSLRHCCSR